MKAKCVVFSMCLVGVLLSGLDSVAQDEPTYAERLGWPKGSKVVIFHIDDAGMSHDSNQGVSEALAYGVATSTSVMMPCPWVPEFARYAQEHPEADAGIHLTLTSEWKDYRWGPVAGKGAVPGLVDKEGCLWDNVPLVVMHATPDEVEKEIRAQVDRALVIGLKPTHLDSHMGTLFVPPFFERYLKVGVETGIPILVIGGHMQFAQQEFPEMMVGAREMARKVWDAGLPVIDDILAATYDWSNLDEKRAKIVQTLHTMKPGVIEIIVHCTRPTDMFQYISPSAETRLSDLLVMTDPDTKKVIEEEGIVLSTWRELKQRRDEVAAKPGPPPAGK